MIQALVINQAERLMKRLGVVAIRFQRLRLHWTGSISASFHDHLPLWKVCSLFPGRHRSSRAFCRPTHSRLLQHHHWGRLGSIQMDGPAEAVLGSVCFAPQRVVFVERRSLRVGARLGVHRSAIPLVAAFSVVQLGTSPGSPSWWIQDLNLRWDFYPFPLDPEFAWDRASL